MVLGSKRRCCGSGLPRSKDRPVNDLFPIRSSNPELLEKAASIASDVAQRFMVDGVVGIVLLGAIPRGYFDRHADVDLAVMKTKQAPISLEEKFFPVDGVEVHIWLSDYEDERETSWDMPKRWTYSQGRTVFDPEGKLAGLLEEKVPLRAEERRWLLMSGCTMSEWYVNRLTQLWVDRGNLGSAHQILSQGLEYFFDMLFGLNHELLPDMKWRFYCVERLERLPPNFSNRIKDVLTLCSFTEEELARRKSAFMAMWQEMKPEIEEELQLSFEEMVKIV